MNKAVRFSETRAVVLLTVSIVLVVCALHAQAPTVSAAPTPPVATSQTQQPQTPAALPSFDVVSIKTHKDEAAGKMRMGISATPDGFQADGVPLRLLVRQALGVSDDRILNEPDWVNSARFDLDAKVAPEDAPALNAHSMEERFAMLLPVLEDRFGLKFHHETKELSVYTLAPAKGGPKLKETTSADAEKSDQSKAASGGTPPPPLPPTLGGAAGGAASRPGAGGGGPIGGRGMIMRMSTQGMTLDARGTSMSSLAQFISQQISATVVDKTGLTGSYDFTLSFMPDIAMGTGPMMRPPSGAPPNGAETQDPIAPSLFTAVQEQLGLRLAAHKEPVDVIVIEQIQQPTAN